MIDVSPRPLARRRLELLVQGLRKRQTSSAQKIAAEVAELSHRLHAADEQHAQWLSAQQLSLQSQRDASITDWDETLHSRWDDAEMRSFKAVYDSAEREGILRRDARKQVERATAELKQRATEIEQRFLKAKDVPINRLNNLRQQFSELLDQLVRIEHAADAALAQRSLRVPDGQAEELAVSQAVDSAASWQDLKSAIAEAQQACDRFANQPVAKFFESYAWWTACGLIFAVVSAGLALSGALVPVVAILVGAVTTVIVLIISLVGIRPWLKQFAAAEYPKVTSRVQLGRKIADAGLQLAVAENDAELKRLASKRDERFERAKARRDERVNAITRQLEQDLSALHSYAEEQKQLASRQLTTAIADTNSQFEQRLRTEAELATEASQSQTLEMDSTRQEILARIESLDRGGAMRLQIAAQKAMHIVSRSRRWCNEYFPTWERFQNDPAAWPDNLHEPVLPLGTINLSELLPEHIKRDVAASQMHAPLLFSPLQDEYLTITGDPNAASMMELVRNLLTRALTTLPPGKTQVCVIDPPGLGRDFGWLMHLGDFDPQLVSHRVWTQPTHITRQISSLALAAEDFIQQSLRNQFRNIAEYNQHAGALAEPYRLLVWSSFPSGLDEQSWKSLQSVLDTGARCGIIPILIIDPKLAWPHPESKEVVDRRGLHLVLDSVGKRFTANSEAIAQLPVQPAAAVGDQLAQHLVTEIGRRALLSSRVEVPLEGMVPAAGECWQGDSSNCLEIPIGQSGVGRIHALKLGIGTAQHAIIAGKTGSGKSSLLHALITSAALKYSPDRLRLVLLDFKKGVEFQVYSDCQLPHADIIGIESHREFGLSALEYVDACMQRRGESFRSAGVQDLASWNALHPDQSLPRVLVVIDEFQELFVEDDKLSSQASLLLDRIVRQGRSFGVHAVLSSQTLAGAYSLPRTTLGQMAVRIALQCDPSDAQIIFSEDNPAAARLKYPGQAVYNDAGGRIEGNQPMQIGWLTKHTQLTWLRQLPAGYRNQDPSTNRLGRCVVYDGNRAATWNADNADLAMEQSMREINPDAVWCLTGESVAISPAVTFPLTRQAGRNVLLVGAEDTAAASVLNVINSSFVKVTAKQQPHIYVVQGAKPTDAQALRLPEIWRQLECELQVTDGRGADKMLQAVHAIMKQRIEDESSSHVDSPILLNLIQLGRLRSLRREDDFAMGGFGDSELSPDKVFEELLRDGPSHGIYIVIWVESFSTLNRWLSRSAMRECEIRILMQMSANDSTNLMDTIAASRLGDHVMLVFDEATGQEQRFRPFAGETLDQLAVWARTA